MPLDSFRGRGPIADWLDLLEKQAEQRGVECVREPLTSRATFILGDEEVAGKVRTSEEPNRNHPRIWHQYPDEDMMEKAHSNATIITVILDLSEPTNAFQESSDDFIIVTLPDRSMFPGSADRPYFYIQQRGSYYYNTENGERYLRTDWDSVFSP